jgi:hypothetical protein
VDVNVLPNIFHLELLSFGLCPSSGMLCVVQLSDKWNLRGSDDDVQLGILICFLPQNRWVYGVEVNSNLTDPPE